MKTRELQDQLATLKQTTSVLGSMLTAVYDAMGREDCTPETYVDAIYGASELAYDVKEELGLIVEQLETGEKKED